MAIQHPHKKSHASGAKAKHVFKKKTEATAKKKDAPAKKLPARPAAAGKILFLYVILLAGLALFEAPRLTATLADLEGSFPQASWIAEKVQFFAEKTGAMKLSEKASLVVARFSPQDILGTKEDVQLPVVAVAETEKFLPAQDRTPQTMPATNAIPAEQTSTPATQNVPVRESTGGVPVAVSPTRNATDSHGTAAATNATALAGAPHASTKNATRQLPQTTTAAVPTLSAGQAAGDTIGTSTAVNGTLPVPVALLTKTLLALPEPKKPPTANGTIALAGNGTWRFMAVTLLSRNGTLVGNGTSVPAKPVVLLVGDSMMMEGLGPVLLRTLRQRTAFDVVREAKYSTGLCRTDFFNWAEYMESLVETHNPSLVIISLGANDGQDIIDANNKRHIAGTPSWEKMYLVRSEELTKAAESKGAHVVWIGLPIMGKPAHAKYVEQITKQQKTLCQNATRRLYVDTLSVLADEKGKYATFLKGTDGSVTRVRYKDKVHVNIAGGQMLATYVMPYLEPLLPKDVPANTTTALGAGKNGTLPAGNGTATSTSAQGKVLANGTRQAVTSKEATAKGNGTTMPTTAGVPLSAGSTSPSLTSAGTPAPAPGVSPAKDHKRTERQAGTVRVPHAQTSGEKPQAAPQQKRQSAQFR